MLSVVVLLALGSFGCTRAHAKTTPQVPDAALQVPPPPPRDVEPADVETPPPPPPAPTPEPPRTQPPRPRPTTPQREQPPRAEPPKPEPAPAEPPKPAEEPPRTNTLQTTPATVEGELERGVRATLTRATNELNRIDYRGLNTDARVQYDTAKRFIRQAEDAVRAKNLIFAKNLADKAVVIADQLGGR